MAGPELPLEDHPPDDNSPEGSGGEVVVLLDGGGEVVVGHLAGQRPDLSLVEVLARLQLDACRLGWSIRVQAPSPQLPALLDLVGLAGVIEAGAPVPASALESQGQAEDGEQLGVQEALPGRDPAA